MPPGDNQWSMDIDYIPLGNYFSPGYKTLGTLPLNVTRDHTIKTKEAKCENTQTGSARNYLN